jgi:cytidylate kinase
MASFPNPTRTTQQLVNQTLSIEERRSGEEWKELRKKRDLYVRQCRVESKHWKEQNKQWDRMVDERQSVRQVVLYIIIHI